ncbi:MAG: glycine zipper 2TM domain-containing protein [Rhodospirillales bacterium]|nr:glycine zipper 2TM domain-containing protein [Rhodospirillales bacterium]MCB9996399.1 glycine zipper 2TM domain-containing protein [Rhodospirillales bacterium]
MNMKKASKGLAAAFLAVTLAGCQSGPTKQDIGTLVGAIGGGVLGSKIGKGNGQTAGTIAGTLLGAWVGNSVGASLDRADAAYMAQRTNQVLETGVTSRPVTWRNPDTGVQGTITPTRTYTQPTGQYCREFQQTVTIAGQQQKAYGTACRQPDGNWKIQP